MASWAIPMGEQVSIEAERKRRRDEALTKFREIAQYRNGNTLIYATARDRVFPCAQYSVASPCCGDPGDCECNR